MLVPILKSTTPEDIFYQEYFLSDISGKFQVKEIHILSVTTSPWFFTDLVLGHHSRSYRSTLSNLSIEIKQFPELGFTIYVISDFVKLYLALNKRGL